MSRSPCRIAFGITELDPGGAERMLTELVTRLDRREWEPHVYCLGPEAHYAQVLRAHDVPVTCFSGRGFWSAPSVLWRWTMELRRFRPEILYTFLFHANLLGRFAGRLAGVPHLISGIRVAEKRNRWHGRLDRWTNWLVERNVCVSRGVAEFVEQSIGLDPGKTVVIPNAVDMQRFADVDPADLASLGIPPGSIVMITIGRLEHQKGVDILLDAATRLVPLLPQMHFLIVGEGPDREKLQEKAQSAGIANHVHWAGFRDDVPQLLAASTALVLPSRWEGMPNVLLEAMAAGKPIIATDVEGVSEMILPDLNGSLVAPGDSQGLGDAIVRLAREPDLISKWGRESQRICQERFAIRTFVENHVKLFRQFRSGAPEADQRQ